MHLFNFDNIELWDELAMHALYFYKSLFMFEHFSTMDDTWSLFQHGLLLTFNAFIQPYSLEEVVIIVK